MLKAGDVVKGAFAVQGLTLADHHSVVVSLDTSGDEPMAMLVFTTSVKPGDAQARRSFSREFTPSERELANWKNPCRYDATQVALVPASRLTAGGRVPTRTLQEIEGAIRLAASRRVLNTHVFDPANRECVTGHVSRVKRELAYQ